MVVILSYHPLPLVMFAPFRSPSRAECRWLNAECSFLTASFRLQWRTAARASSFETSARHSILAFQPVGRRPATAVVASFSRRSRTHADALCCRLCASGHAVALGVSPDHQ